LFRAPRNLLQADFSMLESQNHEFFLNQSIEKNGIISQFGSIKKNGIISQDGAFCFQSAAKHSIFAQPLNWLNSL